MTICNLDSQYVPASCPDLQLYLVQIMEVLSQIDQLKYGSGTDEPTWQNLHDLWGGCAVPAAAMVVWHNTTTDIISWWVCPTGDYYEFV